MQNYKLILAYDGRCYLGWQKTQTGPSIEAALQTVLEQILQHPVPLQAASRTDAGVHAVGQVVNFLTSKPIEDCHRFIISLNSLLPKDIAVLSAQKMPPSFHPTLDCMGKEYRYYIDFDFVQLPQHRFYSWHCPYPLQINEMQDSLPYLVGEHNFAAFCNVKKNAHYSDYVRHVQLIEITAFAPKRLSIRIQGNHFLYKMVRNLVGTLVYVGRGKIAKEEIPLILQSKNRIEAGMTAPAHGLYLQEVFYHKMDRNGQHKMDNN